MFTVAIKSGTSGHSDYDNCDKIVSVIPSSDIPSVGDTLSFGDKENRNPKNYLVREIKRMYNHENTVHKFSEWIYVYVIEI